MNQKMKKWLYLGRYMVARFIQEDFPYRASALTFSTLLSLVPLLTVAFAILAAFPVFNELQEKIQTFIFSNFIAGSGQVIQTYLQSFIKQTTHLSPISLVFVIVVAIQTMFTIEQTFNVIWQVKKQRNLISAIILYWAMLTFAPLLMGIGFIISSYVSSIPLFSNTANQLGLIKPIIACMPFLLSFLTFSLMYILIPNHSVPTHHGLLGGFFAALLFEIAKFGFSLYIAQYSNYEYLYGTLATIPIFLLWVYLSWLIVLVGALLASALTNSYSQRSTIKPNNFIHAYRWLGLLWEAQQDGKSLSIEQITQLDPYHYDLTPEQLLQVLIDGHLVQVTSEGQYLLSRDLSQFTLFQLYENLPWKLPKVKQLLGWGEIWEKRLAENLVQIENDLRADLDTSLAEIYKKTEG